MGDPARIRGWSLPTSWSFRKAKYLLPQVITKGQPNEPVLASSQRFGVVPQSHLDQRVVTAFTGLGNFKLVLPDDFVISLRSFQGGIEHSAHRGIVSPAYTVMRPAGSGSVGFLRHYLKSPELVARLNAVSSGIRDGRTIRYDEFSQLDLPLPPPAEATRIASFLDRKTAAIDQLIQKKERLIELLQEKRQALITQAVTKGLDPSVPMKESGVEWLGKIPAHWQVTRLMHLTPVRRSIMYGIVLPGPDVEGGIPIVKSGNCVQPRLRLDLLSRTTPEIEAPYARARLQPGDIVYAIRGSVGAAAIVPPDLEGANLTQDAARIAPGRDINPRWLLYVVQSHAVWPQLAAGILGATVKGINIRDLKRPMVPVPPPQEQASIASELDQALSRLDALAAATGQSIDRLREYRQALISAAVTGQIDVTGEAA